MNGLFDNKLVRQTLCLALFVVGAALVLSPNTVQKITHGSVELWQGLVGTGFITAAYIVYFVVEKRDTWIVVIEAFIIASILSVFVIVFNFDNNWTLPLLLAIGIALLSISKRWEVARKYEV